MSGQTEQKKKVTPENIVQALAVIVVIQLAALLITYQNIPTYSEIVNSTGNSGNYFGTSDAGSVGNAIVFVGIVFASTLGLVWILRRKMVFSFRVLIFGSISISAFLLTLVTVDVFAYPYLPPQLSEVVSYGAALGIVVLIGYTIFVKNHPWVSTTILAFVGAEVGSFFALTLPPLTALVLPVAFSIYDIYAVFKGPLKQLIGMAPEVALTGMSIRAGQFTLGLGDVVFYTMLPSMALYYVTPVVSIATILVIDAGVVVTLYLLSKKRLLPGLPIPMILGTVLLAAYLL